MSILVNGVYWSQNRVNFGQLGSIEVNHGQFGLIRVNWGSFGVYCPWDSPIHHILVGSLEDMLVPNAYCMHSWCPWGFMFQLSACDIRNTIWDPPIHHLLVGSLEDMFRSCSLGRHYCHYKCPSICLSVCYQNPSASQNYAYQPNLSLYQTICHY